MNLENHPNYLSMLNDLIKNQLLAQMLQDHYNNLVHPGIINPFSSFPMMDIQMRDSIYFMNPFPSNNIHLNYFNSPIQVNNNLHFLQVQPQLAQNQRTMMNTLRQAQASVMNSGTFRDGLTSKPCDDLSQQGECFNILESIPKCSFFNQKTINENGTTIPLNIQQKKADQASEKQQANLSIELTKPKLKVELPKAKMKGITKTKGKSTIKNNGSKQYSGIKTKREEKIPEEIENKKSLNSNEKIQKAKGTRNPRMRVSELLEDSFLVNIGKNIPAYNVFEFFQEEVPIKNEIEPTNIHVDYKPTNDPIGFMTYNFKSFQEEQTGEKVITDAMNQCAYIYSRSHYLSEKSEFLSHRTIYPRKVWSSTKYAMLCLKNPDTAEIETVITTIKLLWPGDCAISFSEDLALDFFALNDYDLDLTEKCIKFHGSPFVSFIEWKVKSENLVIKINRDLCVQKDSAPI